MPGGGAYFGTAGNQRQVGFEKSNVFGLFGLNEANLQGGSGGAGPGGGMYELTDACQFFATTGTTLFPDVTPAQTSNVVLIPATTVESNMRLYVTRIDVAVQGVVNWGATSPTGIPYLSIQDTNGVPIAHFPFNALKGTAAYSFPASDVSIPLYLGESSITTPMGAPIATFTYNPATGVITASAAVFVASTLIGSVVSIMDGTGKGQSAIVTANTTTTLTISPAFNIVNAPADHNSTAKDSVLAVWYQNLSGYVDTTHMTLENAAGTPFTANALDNGYSLIGVAGASAGSVRPILSNTTAGAVVLGLALNAAMNTTTTVVGISNENNLNGSLDLGVGEKWACLSRGAGLQAAVNVQGGTSPVGSPVRVYVEGYYAL